MGISHPKLSNTIMIKHCRRPVILLWPLAYACPYGVLMDILKLLPYKKTMLVLRMQEHYSGEFVGAASAHEARKNINGVKR
jgi:hypothetical protein